MNHIKTIKHNNLSWHVIDKPTKKQVEWIRKTFNFRDEDVNNCMPVLERPKLNVRQDYLFMILQFPYYDRRTQEIEGSEIDLFITKDSLVLIHNNNLLPVLELQKLCERDERFRAEVMKDGSKLIYEILNRLLHYCFPMLNHINLDIENIEDRIFDVKEKNKSTIKEILRIKRNIVNFRKTMQAHKSIMSKLIKSHKEISPSTPIHLHEYFNHLVNHTKDIWDFLENYKDTIDALHETHESLLSHNLNQIIKTLTIFSVIVFPLTLMAAIFGMNTMNSMPFVSSPYDFWIVAAIMVVGAGLMLFFFKHKKWL